MPDTFAGLAYYAMSSQELLMGYPERCSVDPDKLDDIGVSVGTQIRITHDGNGNKGLATVAEARNENQEKKVRMCKDGRRRWVADGSTFNCTVDKNCLRSDLSDVELASQDEYGERLQETSTTHTKLCICAPHGGYIERWTDEMSKRMYSYLSGQSKDASNWYAVGHGGSEGAFKAWHITSTEISTFSFALLEQIATRGFDYVVSFHGYGEDTIAVGGGAGATLKQSVADAIQNAVGDAYEVEVVTSGPYAGVSEDNFVNWLCGAGGEGVQIELPYSARQDYWQSIADAVASVYAGLI
jgi:phage replication-related protein YjqB (UPF0714/DUF867 family)